MTPRREFSAATRRAAWERANGQCEAYLESPTGFADVGLIRCTAPLDVGNFHYDHIDPDWFSKDNELDNCAVICRRCHELKTKKDKRNIAKSKRIQDKRIKARKPKGRPMPGTKRSGWKKTFSHGWEKRS
jgi:hypothetical protein